ncbi:sugar kinase [Paraglaciecola aestuariivivens]
MSQQNIQTGGSGKGSDVFSKIKGPLVFAGECMLELVNQSSTQLGKSFAGDLYNSCVYLKRAFNDLDIAFMSCVGQDKLSHELLDRLAQEQINTDFLPQISTHHLGAYMVITDDVGERSFLYWRNDSAAKHIMSALSEQQSEALNSAGLFFFSGISIAILPESQRTLFWHKLAQMKRAGVTIVFDPNYRPQLWESVEVAKHHIEKALQLADVLLPGVDDFEKLYGFSEVEQCIEFCLEFEPKELVMKHGEKNLHIVHANGTEVVPIVANDNVVDTTSAGDAFNGVYLGSRVSGYAPKTAALAASAASSKVIETPGAIMPKPLFDAFWQDYDLRA